MGIREAWNELLGRPAKVNGQEVSESFDGTAGGFDVSSLGIKGVKDLSVEKLYRTQPHLRTVVQFIARNVAHLDLHAYERVSETDRQRVREGAVADILAIPNPSMTRYELIENLVSEVLLYDFALWFVGTSPVDGKQFVQPIPTSWIKKRIGGGIFEPTAYLIKRPGKDSVEVRIEAEDCIVFHGYNPGNPRNGSSAVDALKAILEEQINAVDFRNERWKNGGRASSVVSRPVNAPQLDPKARSRRNRAYEAMFRRGGSNAGGTIFLEDGETITQLGFTSREDQWKEVAQLSLQTVASVFHVNPTMVGINEAANYSNVKEFRKMLYGETLGPILTMIETRLNQKLVPRLTDANIYLEFNVMKKLQGDFEEQASVMGSAVGRPWMTAAEARARFNLPSLGGDSEQLAFPLNLTLAGESDTVIEDGEKAIATIRSFAGRQQRSLKPRLGAKENIDWARWSLELTEDLLASGLGGKRAVAIANAASNGIQREVEGSGEYPDTEALEAIIQRATS